MATASVKVTKTTKKTTRKKKPKEKTVTRCANCGKYVKS